LKKNELPVPAMESTLAFAYLGMILTVSSFSLEVRGKLSSRSTAYLMMMLAGQAMLGIRAFVTQEWPFAILAAVWAAVALYGILKPVGLVESDD
jgi:hypothetical protein